MLTMLIKHAKERKRSFKLKILVILTLLMVLIQPMVIFAEPIINEGNLEPEEKPGLVEKHLSKFVLNIANGLISVMKAQDVSVLVFQREEVVDASNSTFNNSANAARGDMIFGIFPSGLFDGIAKIHDIFVQLIPIPLYVLFTLGGLLMMFDMIRSPEDKSRAKEMVLGLIVAVLFIRFGHIAWEWIILINYFIVDAVYIALQSGGIQVKSFIATVWDPSATDEVMSSPSFVTAILVVCALFMTFMMNYQYMMRMIILAMLVILFPLVLISSVIPSRRTVINTWFTQFTSQIFIQSAHAIALGLFFFALNSADSISFWLVLTMFFALPAMADVVQRIVGEFTGEGGGGGGFGKSMANGTGMSSLMAVGMMTKGVFQNKGTSKVSDVQSSDQKAGLPSTNSTLPSDNLSNQSGGKEGVGSVPVSSGLQGAGTSRPRGLAKVGNSIASAGKKMASNPQFGKVAKGAMVGGMAAVGAMAGTMVTGNGTKGAVLGGGAGLLGTKAGEVAKGKLGKGLELGGEVVQSKNQTGDYFTLTKDRLGYHDEAQLSDPAEMKRMGQELIGGKLGSTVGTVAGNIGYMNDKILQNTYEPSKQNYEAINNKRDIEWSMGSQQSHVTELENVRNNARKDLDLAAATHGKDDPRTQDKAKAYNQANTNHMKAEQELRNMREKQANFYQNQQERRQANLEAIRNHANSTQNLKQQRRSSGQP